MSYLSYVVKHFGKLLYIPSILNKELLHLVSLHGLVHISDNQETMTEPVVQIQQGKLKGRIAQDYKGNNYYSFQGIPYAKPPIGELRFKVSTLYFCLIINIYQIFLLIK